MRAIIVVAAVWALVALVPVVADAQGNNCTFPGGGATGGVFPGGNCNGGGGGATVSASEPLSLTLTAIGLAAAARLRRRRS